MVALPMSRPMAQPRLCCDRAVCGRLVFPFRARTDLFHKGLDSGPVLFVVVDGKVVFEIEERKVGRQAPPDPLKFEGIEITEFEGREDQPRKTIGLRFVQDEIGHAPPVRPGAKGMVQGIHGQKEKLFGQYQRFWLLSLRAMDHTVAAMAEKQGLGVVFVEGGPIEGRRISRSCNADNGGKQVPSAFESHIGHRHPGRGAMMEAGQDLHFIQVGGNDVQK